MKPKGFFWTFELLIGIVAILGLLTAAAHPLHEKENQLPSILCHDLLNVWTYGENIEKLVEKLLPEGTYSFSTTPLSETTNQRVICHATRITNGIMEEVFLGIER